MKYRIHVEGEAGGVTSREFETIKGDLNGDQPGAEDAKRMIAWLFTRQTGHITNIQVCPSGDDWWDIDKYEEAREAANERHRQ
jgi:hypothetical protein